MIPVKLIMLGNVGVGKTSLMYQFVHNSYYDSMPATVSFYIQLVIYRIMLLEKLNYFLIM